MSPAGDRTHILVRIGDADRYAPAIDPRDRTLALAIQAPSAPPPSRVTDTVWRELDRLGLSPTQLAIDFYRMASAVYSADARVRRINTFDRWTRDLVLHLPVSDLSVWDRVQVPLVKLLQFLTGDRWELVLRPDAPSRPPAPRVRAAPPTAPAFRAVSLLSGGLDSFVGALDSVARSQGNLFVSHNSPGHARFASPAQDAVFREVQRVATGPVDHLKMTVNPPPHADVASAENTQRSRSIIFIALGVLVASSYPAGMPLVVAENGFISLNVPLTFGRLGSLSTRTTHPHTLALVRETLAGLGIAVVLESPYRFMTKGQMLTGTSLPASLAASIHATNSCARSNDRNPSAARRQAHCGYCVPCIIRRAAMKHAGLDDSSRYRYDVIADRATLLGTTARGKDLRAFEMALVRAEERATVTDVLRAGPLDCSDAEISQYVQVYREGLNEVSMLLRDQALFGGK